MSAPNTTPGPWEVQCPLDFELMIVEAGKEAYEWRAIAGCSYPEERGDIPRKQVNANAHLLAAAPELYEALEAVCEAGGLSSVALANQCLAALRKARGAAPTLSQDT